MLFAGGDFFMGKTGRANKKYAEAVMKEAVRLAIR